MNPNNHGATSSIQSPLTFEQCLKAVRRVLEEEGFQILSETVLSENPHSRREPERRRLAVLVLWSASFAYQALSVDREAGLLVLFCVTVLEAETGSVVASGACTAFAVATGTIGIRAVARVVQAKVKQVFFRLSVRGSVHEAVKEGGGTYRGIQYGSPETGMPDLVLFDDPVTKTTLAPVLDGPCVRSEAVSAKIMKSRKVFCDAQLTHGGLEPTDKRGMRGAIHAAWDGWKRRCLLVVDIHAGPEGELKKFDAMRLARRTPI